jgi:hypothetical protein
VYLPDDKAGKILYASKKPFAFKVGLEKMKETFSLLPFDGGIDFLPS